MKSQELIDGTTTETTFAGVLPDTDVSSHNILIVFNKVDRSVSHLENSLNQMILSEPAGNPVDYMLSDLSGIANSQYNVLGAGPASVGVGNVRVPRDFGSGSNVCIELVEKLGGTFGTNVTGRLSNNSKTKRRTVEEIFWVSIDIPKTYIVADTISGASNLEFMIVGLISDVFGQMPWVSEITGYSVDKSMVYKFDKTGVIARYSEVEVSNVSRLIGVSIGTLRGITTHGTSPRAKNLHRFYEVDGEPVLLSVTIDITRSDASGNV